MHLTRQQLKQIHKVDLVTYFKTVSPDELMKVGKNRYRLKSHDSIDISNGCWYRFSRQIGGNNALDYLMKVENMNFYDACLLIANVINQPITENTLSNVRQPSKMKLPPHYVNNDRIIDYLNTKRKICKKIIQDMILSNYIYEAKYDHAVIFLGYDLKHHIQFACKREINTMNKQDIKGSNKAYSFSYLNLHSNTLFVFESVIDLLSYMTILEMRHEDYKQYNYVSLDGVSMKALERVLNEISITNIYLMLDHDQAGKLATQTIIETYGKKYHVFDESPADVKDINDLLNHLL